MTELYMSKRSHFSRKVRILLEYLGISYNIREIKQVGVWDPSSYAGNPLCRVPVFVHDEDVVFGSDEIARYIVSRWDPSDGLGVKSEDLKTTNTRSVLNGLMAEEVTYIIAERKGERVLDSIFFRESLDSISMALDWLEANYQSFKPHHPGYTEFHLLIVEEVSKNKAAISTNPFLETSY